MNFLVSIFFFALAYEFIESNPQRDKIFFLQKSYGNETLLVVTWGESVNETSAGCEIFTDKELIDEVLRSSKGADIRTLSEDQLQNLLQDCTEFILRRKRRETNDEKMTAEVLSEAANPKAWRINSDAQKRKNSRARAQKRQESASTVANNEVETTELPGGTEGYNGLPVVFPGTNWCGAGDIAKNYDDLGIHQDTDRCCRAHDLCNDTIPSGETKYNLTNKSPFTTLSCQCDQEFYDCLKRINCVISNTIGNMYFNILKRHCYKKEYPFSKKCKKYMTIFKLTCIEYERDTTEPKVYQWIPPKKYKMIPFPGPLTVTLPF